jgi:hypothetical protein
MSIQLPSLRPLKAGEILDRAFRLYRANFWLFTAITGILVGPLLLIQFLNLFFFHDIPSTVYFIQLFLTINLLNGAMIRASSRAYLGLPTSLSDSYNQALRHFGSVFIANFLQGLAYLPIFILLVAGLISFNLIILIIVLFLIPFLIFLPIRWSVVVPTIMIENQNSIGALQRSWLLTSQNFKYIFLILIASLLFSYMAFSIPETVILFAAQKFGFLNLIGSTISLAGIQLGPLISIPLSMNILVVLYYDLRVRREGYDLELALQATPEISEIRDISNEQS